MIQDLDNAENEIESLPLEHVAVEGRSPKDGDKDGKHDLCLKSLILQL